MVNNNDPTEPAKTMPFLWLGNHPATDLCNTTPVVDGVALDLLPNVEAIQAWASESRLTAQVNQSASHTLRAVHALRTAIRAALEAAELTRDLVAAVNEPLTLARGSLAVDPSRDSDPVVHNAQPEADQLLLDIAVGVVDIFRHDRRRIHRCANPDCVLLFLDTSKSGRRRWCDMATCGNRAKVAAHYTRRRP